MGEGPSAEKKEKKNNKRKEKQERKKQKQHCRGHLANNTDGDWHNVLSMTGKLLPTLRSTLVIYVLMNVARCCYVDIERVSLEFMQDYFSCG